MFDRKSEAYQQLVSDVADAVITRLSEVADDATGDGRRDEAIPMAAPPGLTKREAAVLQQLVAGGIRRPPTASLRRRSRRVSTV